MGADLLSFLNPRDIKICADFAKIIEVFMTKVITLPLQVDPCDEIKINILESQD